MQTYLIKKCEESIKNQIENQLLSTFTEKLKYSSVGIFCSVCRSYFVIAK